MPITSDFALRVRDLHRRGMTPERIAVRLTASVDDVREACRMLDLPQHGDTSDAPPVRSDAERGADLERMPKKMQDRIGRAKT